ncbi:Small ubiquitin-related modifier 3 [Sciurus carolinensis]|uniref:Small ubiquitin-related modifier 3 n=1 Tax=Sciurus carolinensis TaxID=30640 RepID=A0AA41MLG8_SCICA|nr:Small ubiquitin-related modifier 3 [Sciurus carolinensis]
MAQWGSQDQEAPRLSKLMPTAEAGSSMRQTRFWFDGQPINEADTPAQLEMEAEDTIDVFQQRTGGRASGGPPHTCCRPRICC